MRALSSHAHHPSHKPSGEDDLQHLVRQCKEGVREAQWALYQRYAEEFYAICLRYAGSAFDAEDFLQEAFVKIFNKLDDYRQQGSFEGWMRRIVVNTAITELRKRHPMVDLEEGMKAGEEPFNTESILDKMAADELLELIQAMPTGYRTVFNLYALEGYSHQEIAEMCRISPGTSKSQFARARQHLQQQLAARYPEKARKLG